MQRLENRMAKSSDASFAFINPDFQPINSDVDERTMTQRMPKSSDVSASINTEQEPVDVPPNSERKSGKRSQRKS